MRRLHRNLDCRRFGIVCVAQFAMDQPRACRSAAQAASAARAAADAKAAAVASGAPLLPSQQTNFHTSAAAAPRRSCPGQR